MKAIAHQGEISIYAVEWFPNVEVKPFTEKNTKGYIISHSEQGHHHILGGDVEVMERVKAPQGATILHAIVTVSYTHLTLPTKA